MAHPASVDSPPGQFMSWQPGKVVAKRTPDSIWTLEPQTDLVLQMHMQPTGKPESIQPAVAFYFTNSPPTRALHKISLGSYAIDIPAGATDYAVTDSYVLPVDVEVLAVLPHAHYLGKQIQGFATLPDGTKQWLLRIQHWDFNWQGDYRFTQPVPLPKGTTLTMQWTFDNSTNNVRNPRHPPTRVRYGVNTTNEMAELWFQVRLRTAGDLAVIEKDSLPRTMKQIIELNTYLLRLNPRDAPAHAHLGEALMYSDRLAEAVEHFKAAIALEPSLEEPHYNLGLLLRQEKQMASAQREFETVLRLNPENYKAHGNLGFIAIQLGDLDQAELHLRAAQQINPDDKLANEKLAEVLKARGKPGNR